MIVHDSPISRADIANVTGLNKGTVSSLVSELLADELIYESGQGQSSGGRRPVMLFFNEKAGYAIGIDIGVDYLLGVLADLQGNICHEQKTSFHNLSFTEIQLQLFNIIDHLIASAPPSPYGIVGIGIGVPGTVNKNGEVLLAPNLNWKNVTLKDCLQEKYNVPITIENEANAGAYGEKRFGIGKNFKNITYLSMGTGIGAGLILGGKLYKGIHGFSGELGHMTIVADGMACKCGSEGCWELYASEQALLNNAAELGIAPASGEDLSLEYLLKLAENNDKITIDLFNQIGYYIGIGIKNMINIFNPEQIIIGNRLSSAKKWLEPPIKAKINQTIGLQQEEINFLNFTTYSTTLGLIAFSVEDFLDGE